MILVRLHYNFVQSFGIFQESILNIPDPSWKELLLQVSKTVNDDKQGFWLERIFLEKERSSERTMVFDIGRKNIKMKFFSFSTGDIGL